MWYGDSIVAEKRRWLSEWELKICLFLCCFGAFFSYIIAWKREIISLERFVFLLLFSFLFFKSSSSVVSSSIAVVDNLRLFVQNSTLNAYSSHFRPLTLGFACVSLEIINSSGSMLMTQLVRKILRDKCLRTDPRHHLDIRTTWNGDMSYLKILHNNNIKNNSYYLF